MIPVEFIQHSDMANKGSLPVHQLRRILALEGAEEALCLPLMKPMPQALSALPCFVHEIVQTMRLFAYFQKAGETDISTFLHASSAFDSGTNQQHCENYR